MNFLEEFSVRFGNSRKSFYRAAKEARLHRPPVVSSALRFRNELVEWAVPVSPTVLPRKSSWWPPDIGARSSYIAKVSEGECQENLEAIKKGFICSS